MRADHPPSGFSLARSQHGSSAGARERPQPNQTLHRAGQASAGSRRRCRRRNGADTGKNTQTRLNQSGNPPSREHPPRKKSKIHRTTVASGGLGNFPWPGWAGGRSGQNKQAGGHHAVGPRYPARGCRNTRGRGSAGHRRNHSHHLFAADAKLAAARNPDPEQIRTSARQPSPRSPKPTPGSRSGPGGGSRQSLARGRTASATAGEPRRGGMPRHH